MATISETGHAKNVANFETLITNCKGFGEAYNPSSNDIKIDVMVRYHLESKTEVREVKNKKAPFDEVEGHRKTHFKAYGALATKIMGALKASGAPITVIQDAETINKKMQGKRATGATIELKEDGTAKDRISVSQLSYDMKIDHLEKMIELLSIEPAYNPNENPLKVSNLTIYRTELETINSAVKNAYVPYYTALISRNKKLYDPEKGLVARALQVKNYVKSVYGANSPEFKRIQSLKFRTLA